MPMPIIRVFRWIPLTAVGLTLTGCLSISGNKPATGPELYDFGYQTSAAADTALSSQVGLENVNAAESLNHIRIRYRLAYDNPDRVQTYSQSRWAATPRELVAQALRPLAAASGSQPCLLRLQLESFDQVFSTPAASEGVVTLNASLLDRKSRTPLGSKQLSVRQPAPSPDAAGGVAALHLATDRIIADTLQWANQTANQATACNPGP